ncbi:MAG TPA: hypothetical protein VIP77_11670 [Jiangellaceae bacterium]
MTSQTAIVSALLCDLDTAPAPIRETASHQLLAGLDLAPRTTVPHWVTDPDMRASILAGLIDIPDDLRGDR